MDTPVTLPGHVIPRAESPNGIPETIEFENTGQIMSAVMEATGSEDLMGAFVQKAFEQFAAKGGGGGDGGDGGAPEKVLKDIKKHKWLAALFGLLFGSGGMVGSYYALKAQSAANTVKVQEIEAAAKATEPRIKQNTEDIRLIKVDVSNINKSVGAVKDQNAGIAAGIETLKKEAQTEKQTRLEEKVKALERENRRLERNR